MPGKPPPGIHLEPMKMPQWLKDRWAIIALWAMFFGSWALQYATHDGSFEKFVNATAENWQSEAWQVAWLLFITKFLRYKDSPQSREDGDRFKLYLQHLIARGMDDPQTAAKIIEEMDAKAERRPVRNGFGQTSRKMKSGKVGQSKGSWI